MFFAVERTTGTTGGYHLNLYAADEDGAEVLMTHDHVVAKASGGTNTDDNTQTMCGPCNWAKGSTLLRDWCSPLAAQDAKPSTK